FLVGASGLGVGVFGVGGAPSAFLFGHFVFSSGDQTKTRSPDVKSFAPFDQRDIATPSVCVGTRCKYEFAPSHMRVSSACSGAVGSPGPSQIISSCTKA